MAKKITIDLDEALRVFYLVEEMQSFFHQPMNFPNVETFAKKNYPEIKAFIMMWYGSGCLTILKMS